MIIARTSIPPYLDSALAGIALNPVPAAGAAAFARPSPKRVPSASDAPDTAIARSSVLRFKVIDRRLLLLCPSRGCVRVSRSWIVGPVGARESGRPAPRRRRDDSARTAYAGHPLTAPANRPRNRNARMANPKISTGASNRIVAAAIFPQSAPWYARNPVIATGAVTATLWVMTRANRNSLQENR